MTTQPANPESDPSEGPSIQQAANDLREAAGQRARDVAESAEDRARMLKDSAAEKAQQFREYTGEKATHIKEVAGEQWQETRVKAKEVHGDFEEYIRQHPTKSVLIAAGTGLLLGLLVRR